MNASERFFRRYIFSTVGIVALFLTVNVALVASYFVIAYFGNVATSNFPIEDFSNHVVAENGQFTGDAQATEMLNKADAWAMILDEDGTVIWEENRRKNYHAIILPQILQCSVGGISMIIQLISGSVRMGFLLSAYLQGVS